MQVKEFIVESKKLVIYHGDNYKTTKLDPSLMNNGNNQEGIGIYFGSLKTAKDYGKFIVKLSIDPTKFVDSRLEINQVISIKDISKILYNMWKIDENKMFYLVSDWVEIYKPTDITKKVIDLFADKIKLDEVRNFQITLADSFGVENFVKTWNAVLPNIHGTFHKQASDTWYAVINDKLKIEPYDM